MSAFQAEQLEVVVAKTFTPRKYWDERLHQMLKVKRPHASHGEAEFVNRFIAPYKPEVHPGAAYVIEVPRPDGSLNRVMFSAHVDTVHREAGQQSLCYDKTKHEYFKTDGKPLGADNAAGCWLLLEMIDARVPGTYIFHRGEECGGIGSSIMAREHEKWMSEFDMAIAFDRRGTYDVITHQGWERTASAAFAESLCDALNAAGEDFFYVPDDSGTFTDTKNYSDIIPECTNISVGYSSEHTSSERLNVKHLFALREAVLKIDWESLTVERDPKAVEYLDDAIVFTADWVPGQRIDSKGKVTGRNPKWEDEYDQAYDRYMRAEANTFGGTSITLSDLSRDDLYDLAIQDLDAFVDLVYGELNY